MKNVLMIFWIISLTIIALLINACDLSSSIAFNKNYKNQGPAEIIDSVTILATNENLPDWKINAKKIDKFTDNHQWIGYTVRFESLSEANKTIITCNEAFIDETSNIIRGKGNVIINSPKGYLKTELLTFNRMNNEINAPGYVYLKRGDSIIKGINLTTDINFDYIDLKKVSGQGTMNEEDFN